MVVVGASREDSDCDFRSGLVCKGDSSATRACGPRDPDGTACSSFHSCAGGYCDHGVCTSTPHPHWCNL